jgi:hypothetical protein
MTTFKHTLTRSLTLLRRAGSAEVRRGGGYRAGADGGSGRDGASGRGRAAAAGGANISCLWPAGDKPRCSPVRSLPALRALRVKLLQLGLSSANLPTARMKCNTG